MVIKSTKDFKSKQSLIRGTNNLEKEERFRNALQNGDSFIACIETKNLTTEGHDDPMQSKLSEFLNDKYPYQFIWVTASRRSKGRNVFMSNDFCSDYIQIPDLDFGASRNNPIKALCPIADILSIFLLEEKNKVSVLFKTNYLRIKKQRENQYLVPCLRYVNFFKTQDDNVNKENRNPSRQGTSGSKSKTSSSAVRNQSGPSDLNSGTSGFSTEVHGSQKSCTSSQSLASEISNENDTESVEHDLIESDESDDENDKSRKIKFSNLYAEITSQGITRKVEIGSFDYYPSLKSKVGFQIEIFQFMLTITATSF